MGRLRWPEDSFTARGLQFILGFFRLFAFGMLFRGPYFVKAVDESRAAYEANCLRSYPGGVHGAVMMTSGMLLVAAPSRREKVFRVLVPAGYLAALAWARRHFGLP